MKLELSIQSDRLDLIFKNNNQDTMRIWEFHNSWGWHTLFLVIKKTGSNEEFTLTKLKQMGWTRNFSSFTEILPHEIYKLNLTPREKWWESENDLSGLEDQNILVKAVLEIPESPEAKEFGVFVGKVESEWVQSDPPHRWLFQRD